MSTKPIFVPTFSIIIAIYNAEKYLEESIESVIQQTIAFKKEIQLILVNDGSEDSSAIICQKYCQKFPQNIVYLEQKNKGVSSARNRGIELASGKYLNFLDADDYFDKNVLRYVKCFFESHNNEIDVVAVPLQFFEARNGPHMLNKKFSKNRIIDVYQEPESFVLQSGSTFICRTAFTPDTMFRKGQKYAEDAALLTDIIMKKGRYGVINTANYNYRKRKDNTSALQNKVEDADYWFDFLEGYQLKKIKRYLERLNYVPRYVQFVLMYDIQWHIKIKKVPKVLEARFSSYIKCMAAVLQFIDNEVIDAQKYLSRIQKTCVKYIKEHQRFTHNFSELQDYILHNYQQFNEPILHIERLKLDERQLNIRGYLEAFEKQSDNLHVRTLPTQDEVQVFMNNQYFEMFTGKKIYMYKCFELQMDLSSCAGCHSLRLCYGNNTEYNKMIKIKFEKTSVINTHIYNNYLRSKKWLVTFNFKESFFIVKSSNSFVLFFQECKIIREIMKKPWSFNYKKQVITSCFKKLSQFYGMSKS